MGAWGRDWGRSRPSPRAKAGVCSPPWRGGPPGGAARRARERPRRVGICPPAWAYPHPCPASVQRAVWLRGSPACGSDTACCSSPLAWFPPRWEQTPQGDAQRLSPPRTVDAAPQGASIRRWALRGRTSVRHGREGTRGAEHPAVRDCGPPSGLEAHRRRRCPPHRRAPSPAGLVRALRGRPSARARDTTRPPAKGGHRRWHTRRCRCFYRQ